MNYLPFISLLMTIIFPIYVENYGGHFSSYNYGIGAGGLHGMPTYQQSNPSPNVYSYRQPIQPCGYLGCQPIPVNPTQNPVATTSTSTAGTTKQTIETTSAGDSATTDTPIEITEQSTADAIANTESTDAASIDAGSTDAITDETITT